MGEWAVDLTTTGWRWPRRSALVLTGLVVLTAGCGGEKPLSGAKTTSTTTKAPTTTVIPPSSPWSHPSGPIGGSATDHDHLVPVSDVLPGPERQMTRAYRYNGTAWSGALPVTASPAPSPPAADLSCGSPTFCVAIPGGNEVVRWNGSSWTDAQTLGGAQGLQAVGCTGGGFCAAVDGVGNGYFYNGQWSSAVNAWGGPSSISCINPTFCMATTGGTSQWNGGNWSQPVDVDTSGQLDSVSCVSPSFCVAADTVGNVLVWHGSSWSAPELVDPGYQRGGYREQRARRSVLRRTRLLRRRGQRGEGGDLQRDDVVQAGGHRRLDRAGLGVLRQHLVLHGRGQARPCPDLPLSRRPVETPAGRIRACRGRPTRLPLRPGQPR